jgi:hypothetical protein
MREGERLPDFDGRIDDSARRALLCLIGDVMGSRVSLCAEQTTRTGAGEVENGVGHTVMILDHSCRTDLYQFDPLTNYEDKE